MFGKFTMFLLVAVLLCLAAPRGRADTLPVGILSFDSLNQPSDTPFALDVTNLTQPSLVGLSPVVTQLDLLNLSLLVDFADGSSASESLSPTDAFGDFSTGAIFAGNVVEATLTGNFAPTSVILGDGSTTNILSAFSVTITDPFGPLQDGDLAVFNAETAPVGTPEPDLTLLLLPALVTLFCLLQKYSPPCRAASLASQ